MAETKAGRSKKRQLGQFMTPEPLARRISESLALHSDSRVLEPSFGDGSFLIPLIEKLMALRDGTPQARLRAVLTENLFGIEIDDELRLEALDRIATRFGPLPEDHNLVGGDFFRVEYLFGQFDFIVGNPPYGGTFDPRIEDQLDRAYGMWEGHKLKKETYSFFIARSLDWLAMEGTLALVTSDTFMTIKTMGGLRRRLMDQCHTTIETLPSFSAETNQPTLLLRAIRSQPSSSVVVDGLDVPRDLIATTGNFSWRVGGEMARYFLGPTLGEFIIGTGGLVIGKNELFVRKVDAETLVEPYTFSFFEDPITLKSELARARLNHLSEKKRARIAAQEAAGETRRNVRVDLRPVPRVVELPHPDYRPYNKATSGIVYCEPKAYVLWKDDGDAVLTYKKNGNWYLHGVGGRPYFGREGLTWQLVSPRINMRYLPSGLILDSGSPCAFLREGVAEEELWFVLAWCLTDEATRILKTAINHTRNIQGKDIERLPYPFWVDASGKAEVIAMMQSMITDAKAGRRFDRDQAEVRKMNAIFAYSPSDGRRS